MKTRGIEPLVDHSKSHVVTSNQYLGILCQKVMQKEVVEKEREIRRHEKEARTTQQIIIVANANIMRIQMQVERRERTIFNSVWYPTNVREARNILHRQIVVNVLVHVPLSNNLNFGNITLK
jgi:hypothetical protein